MSQTILPDSDVSGSNVTFSTGSDAYSLLNTDTSGGYVEGPDVSSTETDDSGYARVGLQDPLEPIEGGDIVVTAYVKKTDDSSLHDAKNAIKIGLINGGAMEFASVTKKYSDLGTSYAAVTLTVAESTWRTWLSGGLSGMSVKLTFYSCWGTLSEEHVRCSYVQVVVPDKINSGFEMGMMF